MVRAKVALVTGAGTGIGKGIALAFGQQGADVVVHYNTSAPGAADVAAQIRGYGSHAMICQADLRDESAIQSMFQLVVDQFGRVDILVNNSGVTLACSFLDLSVEDWDLVHGINLRGMFLCSQEAVRDMIKRRWGRIINISLIHAHSTLPGYVAYAASKGGVNQLTRAMAVDLAPLGITVNAIGPGGTEIEKFLTLSDYDPGAMTPQIPAGRMGSPRDIASMVLCLASESASWVTGQVLYVDGGATVQHSVFPPPLEAVSKQYVIHTTKLLTTRDLELCSSIAELNIIQNHKVEEKQ
jgi:3-oxoacyl-[acyl-carrier protein] reductase